MESKKLLNTEEQADNSDNPAGASYTASTNATSSITAFISGSTFAAGYIAASGVICNAAIINNGAAVAHDIAKYTDTIINDVDTFNTSFAQGVDFFIDNYDDDVSITTGDSWLGFCCFWCI